MNIRHQRSAVGQAFAPMIIIAALVIAAVGMFAFEIARTTMIRDQLQSATEAAALAGAASLAGSSQLDPLSSQTNGMACAKNVLVRNEVFGTQLDKVEQDFANNPAVGHVKMRMTYLDPKNHNAPVPVGDPKAKVLLVETKFGFTPMFGPAIGLTNKAFNVDAIAHGGVGDLDVVMCFDFSGSMDDETMMTDVCRRWDAVQGKIVYDIVKQGKHSTHQAILPQQLEFAASFNPLLRGSPNTGAAPGNFPPGTAAATGFTDSVVNLDEQQTFAGLSAEGFDFPSVPVLVEAARGNLENASVFHSSQADTVLNGVVAPRAGYQAKYFELAKKHTHPIFEAEQAAQDFFVLMKKNANAHFGLVAFDDQMGRTPTQTVPMPNYATTYSAGGNGNFPIPGVPLKKPEDETNFDDVVNGIGSLTAFGGTNIGGSVSNAIDMFDTGARDNAKKVIILFTDGEPTNGGPLSGDPRQNCSLAARKAKSKGIAVYTVGLALDPSLIPVQQQVLGDNTATGMAQIAGNGSRYFAVTQTSNLRSAFASIARHLSQLTE